MFPLYRAQCQGVFQQGWRAAGHIASGASRWKRNPGPMVWSLASQCFSLWKIEPEKILQKTKHINHMGSLSPTIINNPRFSPRTLCPNILRPSDATSWCHSAPPSGTEKYSRQRLGKERLATSTVGIGIQGYDCHKKICRVHPEDCEKETLQDLTLFVEVNSFLHVSILQLLPKFPIHLVVALCANLPRVVPPGQVEIWRKRLPVVLWFGNSLLILL